MKKFLLLGFALLWAVAMRAEDGDQFTDGDFVFSVTSEETHEVAVIGLSSDEITGEVTIPESITNPANDISYNVTGINSLPMNYYTVVTVTIPATVAEISVKAFNNAYSLENIIVSKDNEYFSSLNGVLFNKDQSSLIRCPRQKSNTTIPSSVKVIGKYAFSDCYNLNSVTIPNSVTSIEDYAFCYSLRLNSVTIPNSVTSIGQGAFQNCNSLNSVTIPNSVISIGESAFTGCYNLPEIIVEEGNANFSSLDGVLYNKGKSILIQCPGAKTEINIPESVTEIGDLSFVGCKSLTSVTIPESVTEIGTNVFLDCSNLTSVTIPNSVTSIKYGTFAYSGLTSVTIPESVTEIGETAFRTCTNLTIVSLPESITSIGFATFQNCYSLTSITIPESVTSIDESAFASCENLTSITIPEAVTTIGRGAFNRCVSLTSITIPESVTEIGQGAFQWCTNLTSVTIPKSITSIGQSVFGGCSSIKDVYYSATRPRRAPYNTFDSDVYENATLYVPQVAIEECKEIDPWKNFATIKSDGLSGIVDVTSNIDLDLPYEVYTTGGIKIGDSTDNLAPGLYLIRQGNQVSKFSVK